MKKVGLFTGIFLCFALLSVVVQASETKKTIDTIVPDNPSNTDPSKPNSYEIQTEPGGKEAKLQVLEVYDPEKGNNFGLSLKIATGVLNHDFKQTRRSLYDDGKGKITQSESIVNLKDSLPFIGLGISARWNKWMAEAYAQKSARGQSQEVSGTDYRNSSFRDSDYSAAVGYELFKNLSISIGYKITKSEINTRDAVPSTQVGQKNIPQLNGLQEFTTYGPSLGITYSWKLNEDMSIGSSVAYGWLKGDRTEVGIAAKTEPTQGISLGVSFNHRIPRTHIKYSISFDHYQYSMKATSITHPIAGITLNSTVDVKQALDTLRATLIYEF